MQSMNMLKSNEKYS